SGSKPLKIKADTLLSSCEVSVRTEPEILAPGATGDLVISYTPSAQSKAATQRPRLFLDGLGVAPRERAIELFVTTD
ncbi:MAG: hypothetical protein IKU92_01600, partial [Rikenellaceae bacterium]|nr:hypothetical protein [Rikenellaceae bacterium]